MVFNAFRIVLYIKVLTLTMLLNVYSLNNLTVLLLPVPLGGAPTNVPQTHPELSAAYLIKMRSDPSDFRCCKFSPYVYVILNRFSEAAFRQDTVTTLAVSLLLNYH